MSYSEDMLKKIEQGQENPFWTIEALGEHAGSLQYVMGQGNQEQMKYHLHAIQDYSQKLFQVMAALLPELYESSEGEREPKLPPDAYERVRTHLARYEAK